LVSFDEPPAAAATMHNVLFRTVEMASFVLVVDYIPTTVRSSLAPAPLHVVARKRLPYMPLH